MGEIKMQPWQHIAITNPYTHFAFYGGVATGKTFTGSHFSIKQMQDHPDLTGFIGANTYDQLSQATLSEFFYYLQEHGIEFIHDRKPPEHWKAKKLKKYSNTVICRIGDQSPLIFTRVLSKGNPLRGIEFSWYWLDETRDTPENTHDVVLSRMRESKTHMKGLITTTTNGKDWSWKRFRPTNGDSTFGCMHVPTIASVEAGVITHAYYNAMRKAYSPMMAMQELEAKHVNVLGGRAYYAAGDYNKRRAAPWGDVYPNPERPLIIGCDFNFQPAPCVWMVGQLGPHLWGPKGEYWGEHIHWFGEISEAQISSPEMANKLVNRYGTEFFYEIYGDASGKQGTTSNAGDTDYNQIAEVLGDAGVSFSIDVNKQNPRVKDRVERMNSRLLNGLGEVRMTYDPEACPLFDGDLDVVGWKITDKAKGKLDNGGDVLRTHASDGAGYAVMKKFPDTYQSSDVDNIGSSVSSLVTDHLGG